MGKKLSITLIFCSGVLVGALACGAFMRYQFSHHNFRRMALQRISHHLHLNNDQEERMQMVLSGVRAKVFELRERNEPEIEKIVQSGIQETKSFLSPEQVIGLGEMWQHFKERMHDRARERESN